MVRLIRFCSGSVALLLCLAVSVSGEGNEPPEGSATELPVPNDEQAKLPGIVLRFCYCPSGTQIPGKPGASAAVEEKIQGFYINEAEISVAEFTAMLGEQGLEQLLARLEKHLAVTPLAASAHYDRLLAHKKKDRNRDEPIFSVAVTDIVAFCNTVNKRLRVGRQKGGSLAELADESVRLPSYWEWQYACRARSSPATSKDVPHFPAGVNRKPMPKWDDFDKNNDNPELKKAQGHCVTLLMKARRLPLESNNSKEHEQRLRQEWKEASQEKVQELLLEIDRAPLNSTDRRVFNDILEEYFEMAYNWPRRKNKETLETYAARREMGKPNAADRDSCPNEWQIWGMFDNVTEWVLWQSPTSAPPVQVWKELAEKDGLPASDTPLVFLAGGALNEGYANQYCLTRRTLWGGPRLDKQLNPVALRYSEKEHLELQPGFRLVLIRKLVDSWPIVLERAGGKLDPKDVKEKVKLLDPNRADEAEQLAALLSGKLDINNLEDGKIFPKDDPLLQELAKGTQ